MAAVRFSRDFHEATPDISCASGALLAAGRTMNSSGNGYTPPRPQPPSAGGTVTTRGKCLVRVERHTRAEASAPVGFAVDFELRAHHQPECRLCHRGFTSIALVGLTPMALVARNNLGVVGIDPLIAMAKARPNGLTVGTTGNSSFQAFATTALQKAAGIDLLAVPYKGGEPLFTDVLGRQIDLAVMAMPGAMPHVPNANRQASPHHSALDEADDQQALLRACGAAPAVLFGSSYGGDTALALAAARPELLRALVLVEPPLMWLADTLPNGRQT